MLRLLAEYAHKHELVTEPGFAPKSARWAIVCGADGQFLDLVEIGDVEAKKNPGREFPICPDLSFPEMKARGVTKSHFLVDTAEVVALLGKNAGEAKTVAKHKYFIKLLRDAGSAMPELALAAECLADESTLEAIRGRCEAQKAKPNDKMTLRIGQAFPVESGAWHDWWRRFRATLDLGKSAKAKMRSFMTGELVEPAATHLKIKGLASVGGSSMGAPLIGFDKDAFESYGLGQSANCAVSEAEAATYRAALNDLIAKHSERLAGAMVVHWFKEHLAPEDDPLPWLIEPQEELIAQQHARELLGSIAKGERPDLTDNYYYALTLSGAAGRVMVRDWMEGQFEQLVRNVAGWFDDLSIVHREGGRLALNPKFLAVIGATTRDLNDVPPPFTSKIWRVAVRNEPIPQAALAKALARARVDMIEDHPPNHARMGLLKAYHIRKNRKEGGETMSDDLKPYLNENHPSLAYHCGRLMAVLAGLQRAALGDVGAGVVQRYYAAASSTPALVLGRLVRTSQFHLNKLDSPGLAYWYEQKLAEIWCRLGDGAPATLTLEEQSLFALGYYQQLADLRTKKSDSDDESTPDDATSQGEGNNE